MNDPSEDGKATADILIDELSQDPDAIMTFVSGIVEAMADFTERIGELEEQTNVPTSLFGSMSDPKFIAKLVEPMNEQDTGRFFKFIFSMAPVVDDLGNIMDLEPEEKHRLARQLRDILQGVDTR